MIARRSTRKLSTGILYICHQLHLVVLRMKKILYTIFALSLLSTLSLSAQSISEEIPGSEVVMQAPSATPQVTVRDGAVVPLCAYDELQVFNVMGQEVPNENLSTGVY